MPIIKAKNYIDVYKIKSSEEDIHQMSGRHDKRITTFCNQLIEREIAPYMDDVVIDIGCGDGSFLKQIHKGIAKGFGIVPTTEEKSRLEKEYSIQNLAFLEGLTIKLPCENEIATKVICNGVLILLDSKEELLESLREIRRVSRKNAIIWIGELPHVNEFAYYNKTYGDSITKWIFSELKQKGLVAAVNASIDVLSALFTKETLIINPKTHFYIEPVEFSQICNEIGFEVLKYCKNITLDSEDNVVEVPTRYNYLLRKT
ncbi:methyltransferase domain-containing protein [Brevibacillus choshinensis]|uniref:methyltransferase domain-containing protein n=1 Tax=Brevibacillus choshinensis TaxID=54911 RepID=UPI002E249E8B|nr:methyltransferase domain-containing protein [Brevibacillus choshinensis]MED4585433.1 methyltransferase domain-containing protein [Brevibacillus choshinensis]MED4753932.1 methyltransferase domain-containing protein [Brevibacillus choshinensis]